MEVDIFLTLRFSPPWVKDRAKMVQELLERVGFKVYLASIKSGTSIDDNVIQNLAVSKMAIIFGSDTYGKETDSLDNTKTELKNILTYKKQYVLLKMCDQFQEVYTKTLLLFTEISYIEWMPDTPMPDDLIQKIQDKFFELFPQHPLALKVH